VGLNGDIDRGGTVGLAIVLLVLATELELDALRPMAALLLTLAFGRKVDGGGERDDWGVVLPFEGEPGREIGRDGDLDLAAL
jgi:hypothetical protein